MAVQAQMYAKSSGFPMFPTPPFVGGGGAVALHDDQICLNLQRQQMQTQPFQSRTSTSRNSQCLNVDDTAPFSASVAGKQSFEIDQFILSQTERLKLILREQTKRQISELLRRIESRARVLLNQKDEELAIALNRTSQLDSLLVKLQTENLTWQQIAKQNELHAITLTNTIQQLQHSAAVAEPETRFNYNNAAAVEDTESCCDGQQSGLNSGTRVCKACCAREINVVLLPCRHLCCCMMCDSVIDFCPVCQTEKKGSIEALLS
ncbi:hypothetical protein QQ045_012428 [Rhodiola kirilowii]